MAKNEVSIRLQPSQFIIERKKNAENKLPSDPIATTQEISSVVIGPVESGVSSDIQSGNIGVIQPKMQPWENTIRFAVEEKSVEKITLESKRKSAKSQANLQKQRSIDFDNGQRGCFLMSLSLPSWNM